MLYIKKMSKRFGQKVIIADVSMCFENGCHRLLGRNGTGKSTLLLLISGLMRPDNGQVFLSDGNGQKKPFIFSEVGAYVPDKPEFYPFMTGNEYINFVCKARKHDRASLDQHIKALFLTEHLALTFSEMSLGTRKKLFLALGLSVNAHIILLDEPTVGLDKDSAVNLEKALQSCSDNKVIIFSTHNRQFLKKSIASTLTLTGEGALRENAKT